MYNPLDEDFILEWDRANGTKKFRFPAKKETPVVRYIAMRYRKKILNKIIEEKIQDRLLKENRDRIAKGMAELDRTAKTGEQMRFEVSSKQTIIEEEKTSFNDLAWCFAGVWSRHSPNN